MDSRAFPDGEIYLTFTGIFSVVGGVFTIATLHVYHSYLRLKHKGSIIKNCSNFSLVKLLKFHSLAQPINLTI